MVTSHEVYRPQGSQIAIQTKNAVTPRRTPRASNA